MDRIDERTSAIIKMYKKYLINDDIKGFYLALGRDSMIDNIDRNRIGAFLEENGVEFEQYMDEIPQNFNYIPRRWCDGDTLVIPQGIRNIGMYGLQSKDHDMRSIRVVDASYVSAIDAYAFCYPNKFRTLILGTKLIGISLDALSLSNIQRVIVPKSMDDYTKSKVRGACADVQAVLEEK